MRKFLIPIALFFLVGFVNAQPMFDFDGTQQNQEEISEKVNVPTPLASESAPKGIVESKFFRITETGQEIEVLPEIDSSGKAYYKFKPNAKIKVTYRCSCPSCPSNYEWRVYEYYKFYPWHGGHDHNGNIPPYTTLSGKKYPSPMSTPVTLVNRYGYIYFRTPEFATKAEHKAQFIGTCNDVLLNTFDTKIDGLKLLKPAYTDGLHGGATYYDLVGGGDEHPEHPINHFGKPQTITLLKEIAWDYYRKFSTTPLFSKLAINDMSLRWGGLFDINANWKPPHYEHRYGRQVDVRRIIYLDGESILMPEEQRDALIEIACNYNVQVLIEGEDGKLISPFNAGDWFRSTAPHFHLRFPKFDDEVENPPDVPPDLSECPKF